MSLFTDMETYQPKGTTGNGLCNNGERGFVIEGGHEGKLGRDPLLGPRGTDEKKKKNSLPLSLIHI